jgi:RNA recognition motif-containing protein
VNIYVGNLAHEATDSEVQKAFEAFGKVTSVNIIKDKFSGQSRGFGFVEMASKDEGEAAIAGLNGKDFMGRALNVNEARPRTDHKGGGGGGGRGRGGGGGGRRRSW